MAPTIRAVARLVNFGTSVWIYSSEFSEFHEYAVWGRYPSRRELPRPAVLLRSRPRSILDLCQALHDHDDLKFNLLADITVVDWLGDEYETQYGRFEVVYNLYSLQHNYRFFIKVFLPADKPEIASLTPIWNGANWLEREVWDLFGVTFVGHPDLTKILTPDELEGHPLRKDFPLTYEQPRVHLQ